MLSSQPWRAVTALTLHADSAHVLGNVISGTIFASAVHRRLGPGAARSPSSPPGIARQLRERALAPRRGRRPRVDRRVDRRLRRGRPPRGDAARAQSPGRGATKRGWLDIARPIVGGLALLGALGASPRADLGAHLFGFLAGGLIGLFALGPRRLFARRDDAPRSVHFGERPARFGWLQPVLGAITLGVVIGSWQLALRR